MEFAIFKQAIKERFAKMIEGVDHLYEVDLDKDRLWNLYLDSFGPGQNEIFRTRRYYECSCCRHFIKTIGAVVVIRNNQVETIWGELEDIPEKFKPVAKALDQFIQGCSIKGIWLSNTNQIGTDQTRELFDTGEVRTWNHFALTLPDRFVEKRRSIPEIQGDAKATKEVFKRSLTEISGEAIDTVLELIEEGNLYRGDEWKGILKKFKEYKDAYKVVLWIARDNFLWEKSVEAGSVIGRIRNHAIGTLLLDLSEGTDLEDAIRRYESIVAPSNYKRPKPVYTQRMLDDARKTVEELGYLPSLKRRFATLDDVRVDNVYFINRDLYKPAVENDIFDEMSQGATVDPKKFSDVETMSFANFMKDVLPTATSVDALVENRHQKNFVSLIAPVDPEAKSMFKWGNGFSWAYTGNMTDSDIRRNVEMAGGKVKGALRFSIQWNDEDYCPNDYDAHCIYTPSYDYSYRVGGAKHIYYGNPRWFIANASLDVDIRYPKHGCPAVENIIFESRKDMPYGEYEFFVMDYEFRGGRSGFKAEIEVDGEIYSFTYNNFLKTGEKVTVARVTYSKDGFSIKPLLPTNLSSRDIWGIHTQQFVPVTTILPSPNWWYGLAFGNLHYFFMLKDCINPERPNGFYNEFLKDELRPHRKVFEALGSKAAVQDSDCQLSGLGFSSTQRNELIVRVDGSQRRVIKITF